MKIFSNDIFTLNSESDEEYWRAQITAGAILYLLWGGLGNQLFGLSSAHLIHLETGRRIIIDTANCEHFDSDGLPESLKFQKYGDWATFIDSGEDYLNDLKASAKSVLECQSFQDTHDSYFGWRPTITMLRDSSLFVPPPTRPERQGNSEVVIGVHVRQGDYKKYPYLGLVSFNYYERALKFAISKFPNAKVIFFSDEIEAALKLAMRLGVGFNDGNAFSTLATLEVMSSVDILICANSTYSFWGAYLGNIPAIYPYPWFLTDPAWGSQLISNKDTVINQWRFTQLTLMVKKAKTKFKYFWSLFF